MPREKKYTVKQVAEALEAYEQYEAVNDRLVAKEKELRAKEMELDEIALSDLLLKYDSSEVADEVDGMAGYRVIYCQSIGADIEFEEFKEAFYQKWGKK